MATVAVASRGEDRIEMTLTDEMDDMLYDVPLTVKIRLPDGWANLTAEQAGRPMPVSLVSRENARYALVDAVPDRGRIVLLRAPAAGPAVAP